ncbi:hypothetical protein TRL7639_01304 [Falsiruegeria litorea R37]|uniref:Uncharacterized protein n=1 Tax=Falsiruegeria litorea R37 TaxID=1200284 RepID=A0A1Y5S2K5_9RHOB|nr:hypothetical protein [Falsiruegeria litorea]SLN31161.1 hypothetical protein TRL7639_01304 [Falsiruegeria litorea R37]
MSYSYDFDMFSVMPDEVQQKFQGFLNDIGMAHTATQQVALFRDPGLVEALRGADEEIKQMFLDSGFGLNVYHSGAPNGRFPARDENARNVCVSRLAKNMGKIENLKDRDWGGFDVVAFLDYFQSAEAMDEVEIAAFQQDLARQSRKYRMRRRMAQLGLSVGCIMVVGAAAAMVL